MKVVRVGSVDTALSAVSWVLVGGAVWLGVGEVFRRDRPPAPAVRERASLASAPEAEQATVRLERLERLWSRDLRQTLIEPAPEPVPEPPPAAAAAPVRLPRLAATFVESGRSWGLFVEVDGAIRVRTASGKIGEFRIVEVVSGAATLRLGSREFEVRVPTREEPGTARRRGRAPW